MASQEAARLRMQKKYAADAELAEEKRKIVSLIIIKRFNKC